MGRGMGRGMLRSVPGNKRAISSIRTRSKTRLLLGIIFSVCGLILIIISLLGIKI